jgi:hypothetical protein
MLLSPWGRGRAKQPSRWGEGVMRETVPGSPSPNLSPKGGEEYES